MNGKSPPGQGCEPAPITIIHLIRFAACQEFAGQCIRNSYPGGRELSFRINPNPELLKSADQKTVYKQADKETIIKTYAILSDTQPKLEEQLTQAHSWENQYSNVVEKVLLMRGTVSGVEGTLKSMPTELMLSSSKTQFDQIKVVSQNLNATISRLEIEKMDQVAVEAARASTRLRWT